MSRNEASRDALEHQALEALASQSEKQEYVERPRFQRILAWILTGVMVLGVLLHLAWIAGILK